MTDQNELYAELKPDIQTIASTLFDFSQQCIRDRGDFLPHGAVLKADNTIELVGATSGNEIANAPEILPLLHGGLRGLAKEKVLTAIGVAESVTITIPGQAPTKAIKVLFEHRRGLTIALYMPYEKKFLRGHLFGSMFSTPANPEVNAW